MDDLHAADLLSSGPVMSVHLTHMLHICINMRLCAITYVAATGLCMLID